MDIALPRPKILVVDDELELRDTMRLLLGRSYDVTAAADGMEARELLGAGDFDVVIADERMPRLKGTDLMRWIFDTQPEVERILLSAFVDPVAMMRAINEGHVVRFLLKPCDPAALKVAVADAVGRRRLLQENRRLVDELETRNQRLSQTVQDLEEARGELVRGEKLALAGRLASGFAHDVRNLMTVLLGVVEVTEGSDAAAHSLVEQAVSGIEDLSNELLMVAKGETPRYQLERRDLAEIVRRFGLELTAVQGQAARKIDVVVDGPVECRIAERKIARLLWNLAQNATRATHEGDTITLRAFVRNGQGVLEVEDTGVGIPPAALTRIFQPFFTTHSKGTGLGLEVCKIIADGHGGQIECESQVAKGTTFRLLLPLARDAGTDDARSTDRQPAVPEETYAAA